MKALKYSHVLTALLTTFSVSAFATNDAGLYTVSIPGATAQKGITLQALSDVYSLCISGDMEKRPELTGLNEKIARAAGLKEPTKDPGMSSVMLDSEYKMTVKSSNGQFRFAGEVAYTAAEANTSGYNSLNFTEINWDLGGPGFLKCSESSYNCGISGVYSQNLFKSDNAAEIKADRLLVQISPASNDDDKARTITLISEKKVSLPSFAYTSVDADSDYDQMGQYVPEETVVRGLSIQVPKELAAPVRFINAKTSKATKVSIDFRDFVSCLSTEAAKNLK